MPSRRKARRSTFPPESSTAVCTRRRRWRPDATFKVGDRAVDLKVQDWTGFIGQWDDRVWEARRPRPYGSSSTSSLDSLNAPTWHGSARTSRCRRRQRGLLLLLLFAYPLDVPAGAKTLTLPNNDKIRVLAISVADGVSGGCRGATAVRHAGADGNDDRPEVELASIGRGERIVRRLRVADGALVTPRFPDPPVFACRTRVSQSSGGLPSQESLREYCIGIAP